MGNFYTTVQILDNEKLGSKKFTEKFCKKMADEGYAICGTDEAEQSYILHFAENSSWIAIASEEYTPDGQKARADALRFAKLLKAPCVNTNVIDSDCAVMDVYGATGKKLDTLIMGRADDYFGDDYPDPSEKIWGMFLTDGTTWERFMEVRNGDYTFVEDGLAELAPLIGMDSSNIGFTAEDAAENDETVFLYFKSAGKKPKKLTLNAAFKQVFGQALEPLGFKLVKSKYPYFVRVINDEIAHVVTLTSEKSCGTNTFIIYGGIATIYKQEIDFSRNPKFDAGHWLRDIGIFYKRAFPEDYSRKQEIDMAMYYINDLNDCEKVYGCFSVALERVKKWILPELDKVVDVDSAIRFLFRFVPSCLRVNKETEKFDGTLFCNESYLFIKAKELDNLLDENKTIMTNSFEFSEKNFNQKANVTLEERDSEIRQEVKQLIKNKKSIENAEITAKKNSLILKNL